MKKILLTFITLTSISANAAFLTCEADNEDRPHRYYAHGEKNEHLLIKEKIKGLCNVYNPKNFEIEEVLAFTIEGYGPGLRYFLHESFILTCPSALRRNLQKKPFYGVKAAAAALIGVNAGVFANSRGGTCIMTGYSASAIGAGIAGTKLTFE